MTQLFLITLSSSLQIIGSVLFAYSFCINAGGEIYGYPSTDIVGVDQNELWAACVSKCHGLYLLYNSAFITYLGCIIYAEKYQGNVPLISLFCDKTCFSDTNDDNPTMKFSKNFRVTYLRYI